MSIIELIRGYNIKKSIKNFILIDMEISIRDAISNR